MTKPLLHTKTDATLQRFFAKPSHGIILSGPSGIGKLLVATWIAEQLDKPALVIEAADEKTTISIEQVRTLYQTVRTGSPLVVILKDAHTMNHAAQNAFLKMLEEPPQNITFILTVAKTELLLPTIRSRATSIAITPPTTTALLAFAGTEAELSEAELRSLIFTSHNRPGTLMQTLRQDALRESRQNSTAEAKQFYTTNAYARHKLCVQHSYQRQWSEELLQLLALIIHSLRKQAIGKPAQAKKLHRQAALVEVTAQNLLHKNGNPKIHLTKLAQQL